MGQNKPLYGVRIVDLSNYLPGPLATLILARAGAEVIKIEPPGGDPMRHLAGMQGLFELLNAGKTCRTLDLRIAGDKATLEELIRGADVVVEQFRPGVMTKLGLGFDAASALRAEIIYCAITGYGQSGPDAMTAGHDLNYQASIGLLQALISEQGVATLPHVLLADIAGGSYPAVMNILLALLARDRLGQAQFLDISMRDMLAPFLFWAVPGLRQGDSSPPADSVFYGASPRYGIYRSADGGQLAVAALEEKFWQRFSDLISLPEPLRAGGVAPAVVREAIAARIASRDVNHWLGVFDGEDVCVNVLQPPDLTQLTQGQGLRLPLVDESV